MHWFTLLSALLVGLLGCKSVSRSKSGASDAFHEKAIYAALKSEPVPLPANTPYDGDARQRDAFNEGFRRGWDRAISGAFLHGTFGIPSSLSKDLHEAWSAGLKSGTKVGSDRWIGEYKQHLKTSR